jgi:hypothetical protein
VNVPPRVKSWVTSLGEPGWNIAADDSTHRFFVALTGGYTPARVYDAKTNRELRTGLDPTKEITAAAFSPSGRELALGGHDGTITRYALPSLKVIDRTGGRSSAIGAIAYSPTGDLLAAVNANGASLIDVPTGDLLGRVDYSEPGFDLAFTDDGNRLGRGFAAFREQGNDLVIPDLFTDAPRVPRLLQLPLTPAAWQTAACQAAGRNLTRAEWRHFVGSGIPYHRTCAQWQAAS